MLERFVGKTGNVFRIPPFCGTKVCYGYPVDRFIFAVEHMAKTNQWTKAESAQNAARSMTGECLRWFEELRKGCPEVRQDWQLLKSKLELKFGGSLSLTERFEVHN